MNIFTQIFLIILAGGYDGYLIWLRVKYNNDFQDCMSKDTSRFVDFNIIFIFQIVLIFFLGVGQAVHKKLSQFNKNIYLLFSFVSFGIGIFVILYVTESRTFFTNCTGNTKTTLILSSLIFMIFCFIFGGFLSLLIAVIFIHILYGIYKTLQLIYKHTIGIIKTLHLFQFLASVWCIFILILLVKFEFSECQQGLIANYVSLSFGISTTLRSYFCHELRKLALFLVFFMISITITVGIENYVCMTHSVYFYCNLIPFSIPLFYLFHLVNKCYEFLNNTEDDTSTVATIETDEIKNADGYLVNPPPICASGFEIV